MRDVGGGGGGGLAQILNERLCFPSYKNYLNFVQKSKWEVTKLFPFIYTPLCTHSLNSTFYEFKLLQVKTKV